MKERDFIVTCRVQSPGYIQQEWKGGAETIRNRKCFQFLVFAPLFTPLVEGGGVAVCLGIELIQFSDTDTLGDGDLLLGASGAWGILVARNEWPPSADWNLQSIYRGRGGRDCFSLRSHLEQVGHRRTIVDDLTIRLLAFIGVRSSCTCSGHDLDSLWSGYRSLWHGLSTMLYNTTSARRRTLQMSKDDLICHLLASLSCVFVLDFKWILWLELWLLLSWTTISAHVFHDYCLYPDKNQDCYINKWLSRWRYAMFLTSDSGKLFSIRTIKFMFLLWIYALLVVSIGEIIVQLNIICIFMKNIGSNILDNLTELKW